MLIVWVKQEEKYFLMFPLTLYSDTVDQSPRCEYSSCSRYDKSSLHTGQPLHKQELETILAEFGHEDVLSQLSGRCGPGAEETSKARGRGQL